MSNIIYKYTDRNGSEEILSTNIDTLTPIEALMKLNEIKRMLTKR